MGEVGEILNHPRSISAPLTFRSVGRPVKVWIGKFSGKLRNVLSRLVETHPDQAITLLHAIRLRARLGGYLAHPRPRRHPRPTARPPAVPTLIGTDERMPAHPTQRKSQ